PSPPPTPSRAETPPTLGEPTRASQTDTIATTASARSEAKTTVGHNAGYLAELASHCALDAAAARIGATVATHLGPESVICLLDHPDLAATSWTHTQLTELLDRYDRLLTAANTALADLDNLSSIHGQHDDGKGLQPAALPAPGPSMPVAALGALASVIGLFNSDTTMIARSVANNPRALTSAVTHALTRQPHLNTTIIEQFRLITDDNPMVRRLAALRQARDTLAGQYATAQVSIECAVDGHTDDIDAQIADLQYTLASGPDPHGATNRIANLRAQRRALINAGAPAARSLACAQGLLTQVDAFLDAITTAPAGSYPAALSAALHEARTTDGCAPTHLLHVQINSIGADVISRKWLWNNAITFLGGAAVSYLLVDTRTGSVNSGNQAATATFRYSSWRNRIGSITTAAVPCPKTEFDDVTLGSRSKLNAQFLPGQVRSV
ncbi:hypothetical protein, partial [Mycolicibacterium fortuitum]|uniref:hypothetical protein n=1 Tax=Mycolicibacterium fortuitum TaxID=1766 RepID=UPI000AF72548